ncbi:MAG TPA: metallophosphoesterase [Labilithrix sp.]|jgi:3',5'-cyclic AMP phosphodiesterase CpdA|nr:metallophosphoesterase [Labilithrix sp.]
MALKIGLVTDLHFGPEAFHEGKLRKLTHHAAELTRGVVRAMNEVVRPDLLVNLGDDIEDESRDADLARYTECQNILRTANAELVNVAGNHDTIHLTRKDLTRIWATGRPGSTALDTGGPLFYSLDRGGFHLVVLHTLERTDVEIRIPHAQLEWLKDDLSRTSLPTVVFMHHSASEQDLSDSFWFRGLSHLALVKERRDLRSILEASGKVRVVFNGHVHRNHLDVISGIPYVTIQSLIENLDEDAPGRPAAAYAVATLDDERTTIRVYGSDPARYQIEHARSSSEGGAQLQSP